MALVSPYRPGKSPREQVVAKYRQPTYQAGTKAGQVLGVSGPRQAPESIALENMTGGWEGFMGGVDIAARGPAYVYGRPPATLDTIITNVFGNEKQKSGEGGILDGIVENVRKVPVVGGALGAVGDLTGDLFHYSQGSLNAGEAQTAMSVWDKPAGEKVGFGETFWQDFGTSAVSGRTAGEIVRDLKEAGWTDADVRALESGEKSIWDFPEKKMVRGEGTLANASDFAAKMLLDPTNALFGLGFLSKSARGADVMARMATNFARSTSKVTRFRPIPAGQYADDVAKGLATPAGATKAGFAESLMSNAMMRGDAALAKYRKVAIANTSAQIGLNIVSDQIPEVTQIPLLGHLFTLAEQIGDNKPLSQNDLFMIASILNFPARSLIKTGYGKAKAPLTKALGTKLEREAIEVLTPGQKGSWNSRLTTAMELVGTKTTDDWNDMMAQVMRGALNEKYSLLSITGKTALDGFRSNNIVDLMTHASFMQKRMSALVRREFEAGMLHPSDINRTMKKMVAQRGGAIQRQMSDVPGAAIEDQIFSPERFGQYWKSYVPIAKRLSETFGGQGSPLVPAIADEFVTTEGISWMTHRVRDEMTQAGSNMVPVGLIKDILLDQPVIFKATRGSNEIQRVLAKSTKEVDGDLILKGLRDGRDHAFTMDDWTSSVTEWENSGQRAVVRSRDATGMIDDNLELRRDITPEYGQAELVVFDQAWKGSRIGQGNHVDQIRAQRLDADVALVEESIPFGTRAAGYEVESAVQVGMIDGNVATSALSIRMNGAVDGGAIEAVAAVAMEASDAGRVMTIRRGVNEMIRHGERPNAAEFIWDPGRKLNVEELNDLTQLLRKRFQNRVTVNDTTGIMRVIVKNDKPIDDIERILEVVTKKTGVEPTQQAVLVKDIVKKLGKKKKNDASTTSLADAKARAGNDQRYWVARSRVDNRLRGSDMGGLDDVAGGRGQPSGPSGQPPGRGGSGAYRTGDDVALTRWEVQRGNTPRGSGPEFALDGAAIAQFRGRAADALGKRVRIASDSRLFELPGGEAGAWVTSDGTLTVWRKSQPGRSIDLELNALIGEASEHAVILRVANKRTRFGGRNSTGSTVDIYGDHGWRVVGSSSAGGTERVTLLRDVGGNSPFPEIPPRAHGKGGYQSLREEGRVKKFRSMQQADATAQAHANRLYPDGVVERLPQVEQDALLIIKNKTLSEIEELAVADPTNLAMLRARDIARNKVGGSVESGGAVVDDAVSRAQGGAATEAKMAEAGFVWDDANGWVEQTDVIVIDSSKGFYGEGAATDVADYAVIEEWDVINVGLPPKGIPGNITHGSLVPEADGWIKSRVIHYDDAGLPDAVFTYKTGRQHFVEMGSDTVALPPGVNSKDTIFGTHISVRPDAQGQGLATRLYDQVAGMGYDVTSAPRSFTAAGKEFFTKYTNRGPWYYHGTQRTLGESIEMSGMRAGNPNGNWTTNLEGARRFRPNAKPTAMDLGANDLSVASLKNLGAGKVGPIYRTRVPGGKAVNDEVVQGSRVSPDDMQVTWDDGITWEDVGARRSRVVEAKAEQAAYQKFYDDMNKDYRSPDFSDEAIDARIEDMGQDAAMGEPDRAWQGGVILPHYSKTKVSKGAKAIIGIKDDPTFLKQVKDGLIKEYPDGFYWTQPTEMSLVFMKRDGTPAGRIIIEMVEGATDGTLTGGGGLKAVHWDDIGGHAYLEEDMLADAAREIRDRLGGAEATAFRKDPLVVKYLGEGLDGVADSPFTYDSIIEPIEREMLEKYSGGASEQLNTPLRQGVRPLDIANEGSYTFDDIEALDRATHKGVFPKTDSGEFVTYRGVHEQRYGQFSEDYVAMLEDLRPGDHIMDEAYWSTTSDLHVAQRGYFAGDGTKSVVFEVRNKSGQKMAWMHEFGDEAEILMPRNTVMHVVERDMVYTNPRGAPTHSVEVTMRPEAALGLADEVENALTVSMSHSGYTVKSVEDSYNGLIRLLRADAAVDPTNPMKRLYTITDASQAMLKDLRDRAQATRLTMQREFTAGADDLAEGVHMADDEFWTMGAYADEAESVADQISSTFVRDDGSTLNIVVENLGDDWVDPVVIERAVKDTIDNGGGTFTTDTMAPYNAEGRGGLAVENYKSGTGDTTFETVDLNKSGAALNDDIRKALDNVTEAFPDAQYVGTWHDPATSTLHIGPTTMFPRTQRAEAFALARAKGQKTIFDYDVMATYPTPNAYNMTKGRAFIRKSGKPRTHAQNAKDFKGAVSRAQKDSGKKWDVKRDVIDNPDSRLYMDDNGQTGVLVGPDGRIEYSWSLTNKVVDDAAVPLDEVMREVIEEGVANHAVVPPYAAPAMLDAGFTPVAQVGDDLYMLPDSAIVRTVDDVPKLPTDEEAMRWLYDRMDADMPPPSNMADDFGTPWDEGTVKYLWDAEEEIANFHPHMDRSLVDDLSDLDPAQVRKIRALEAELRQYKTGWTIRKMPESATPFFEGQGKLMENIFRGREALEANWLERIGLKGKGAWEMMWDPVFSKELSRMQQQHLYDEFLQHGATVTEVNLFVKALKEAWEGMPQGPGGTRIFRRPDSLAPNTVRKIAADTLPEAVGKSVDAASDDIVDLVQRSGSRTYRHLQETFPAVEGKRSLGGVIDAMYGKGDLTKGLNKPAKIARRGVYATKTAYHVFRFLADPRWLAMNWFESDWLHLGRAGTKGLREAHAIRKNASKVGAKLEGPSAVVGQTSKGMGMQSVEDVLGWDQAASGWLDPRNVTGNINKIFDVERPALTQEAIVAHVRKADGVYDDLVEMFGDVGVEQWVDDIDDMLYKIDTQGARATVLEGAAAEGMRYGSDALLDDFLDNLIKQHQDNFRDIMHVFHGNVNRSNLERLLNSPLLWWPISYQLKAGKWVLDMLTSRMLGTRSDLLGMGLLDVALIRHTEQYENNEQYQEMVDGHSAWLRAASMAFPMTPFDMGTYMARWTRYGTSWAGAQMGLWEPDSKYPQTMTDFFARSTRLGPLYTADFIEGVVDEIQWKN